jgi:hypothetical protein
VEKINELFAWHTAEINHLDEELARHKEHHEKSELLRVRSRLAEAFSAEVEALKKEYGIT